ncbi:ABC transporter permease [Aurantibacillus circumpalustris]|uniref:ABC transporter permease n=1 Tax=Aurantibacillus circumpalustris TaxID=3036359 RepID=UPI00295ADDBC|nr:ABC transporter permease [Aurantibacillus circumpalustris]
MSFLKENISIAIDSIKANRLRAIITMLIISIGIMALVGILSAIDAIKNGINDNFTSMGANTFTIRNADVNIRVGRKGHRPKTYESITYKEAARFKKEFNFPALTSVSTLASFSARLKFENEKTNPNIQVFGGDENYILTSGYELEKGRNFTLQDIEGGSHITLIGKDVEKALFGAKGDALHKFIKIGSGRYKVIGVLKPKGNSSGFGGDKISVIPLNTARQYFGSPEMSFTINVLTKDIKLLNLLLFEAEGLFRKIRKIPITGNSDFDIVKSDNLATMLIDDLEKVTMGATIIGLITLLGAAIGLMNIMLVSVTERTREIGIRKAMGATQAIIKNQFLIESVVICVMGGLIGILFGIIIGNLISFALSTGFFIPWFWIIAGVIICIVVGLLSGYLPAKRASRLDPIDSLRFE